MADASDITVDGVKVRLHRAGRGAPVLFLHGANGVPQWLPFFDALAEGYELLVPEHPGFGPSDDAPFIRSMSDLAYFYLDFMEALGWRGFHLIGHSMGGWLAAELAVRDCSRVKTITIMSAAGIQVEGLPPGDLFLWSPRETIRNIWYDQATAERVLATPPAPELVDLASRNRAAAAKLAWQPRWLNPDLEKWLHRIKAPALVVWGREDKVFPWQYAELWMKRLPQAQRLLMLERCGHAPHVERAAEVLSAARAFMGE